MDSFIKSITKKAGDAVQKRLGKAGVHYAKSERLYDVVTKSDLLAEKIIMDAILKKYPDHGIISEESGNQNDGAEYVWVIDPIDGTKNYASGMGMYGVMVCLVRRGEVILSAIYLPAMKELYFAKKGKGAYLNGKRIHCLADRNLLRSYGVGSSNLHSRNAKFLKNLIKGGKGGEIHFGTFGSMAVNAAYAASGKRHWMVALAGSIWDFAPAYLILKEAGCKVTDTEGKQWRFGQLEMVAANPSIHKELLRLTKNV